MNIWVVFNFSIMDKVAINILVQEFVWTRVSFLLGQYVRVELLGHKVRDGLPGDTSGQFISSTSYTFQGLLLP